MKKSGHRFSTFLLGAAALAIIAGCSTNPATGERQFTALMSPAQEASIGASEHQKIIESFGGLVKDQALQNYVNAVGKRVAANTERSDVTYKFFVLDTPDVNAFAVPGGYIYTTRGLLALANDEAELAAVLGHEVAHITARHSAERYSQAVVTGLGASVLASAIDKEGAAKALTVGANLYLSSYSRGQESQADDLGIRYLVRAGYDPQAMTRFLASLDRTKSLDGGAAKSAEMSIFATHPVTAQRVQASAAEVAKYQTIPNQRNRDVYLKNISGLTYGDSASQGFIRGRQFVHPDMGFTFTVPDGFKLVNKPSEVVASAPNGAVMALDMAKADGFNDPLRFMTDIWMKGEPLQNAEKITINGLPAATAAFQGRLNNRAATIRIVAIAWSPGQFFRFQIGIPQGAPDSQVVGLRDASFSFKRLSPSEKGKFKPLQIQLVNAKSGDTAQSLSRQMNVEDKAVQRFMVLNGLRQGEPLIAGRLYKVIR